MSPVRDRPTLRHVTLATTTSVGHSGLLDQLIPAFVKENRNRGPVHGELLNSCAVLRLRDC
jgi:ABC-type tungstate transport system permease subunit